jgi:pyruvate dehydrogenase E1 component beta subunit
VQEGSDLSLFAYGAMIPVAVEAAKQVKELNGASIEIIDLRTIWPMDEDAIVKSVEKTGRAVVVHEAPQAGGVGAEIVAIINENCLYSLLKPVARVTGYDTPFPQPGFEDYYMPNPARLVRYILQTLED